MKNVNRHRGFTLIELTVVLLILAIVAGAVTLRMQAPLYNARMRDVVDGISQFDHLTRTAAKEQDRPLRLVIDLDENFLTRADGRGKELDIPPFRIPKGFRIKTLLVRHREISGGKAMVRCSRKGLLPSYALAITSGKRTQWILFTGLTGHRILLTDEGQIREILRSTGRRADIG